MRWLFACTLTAFVLLGVTAEEKKLTYPDTKKGDQTDEYHGTRVADPYRWLEDDVRTSKDVAAWVEAENKVTNAFLETIPEREAIKKRITELWNYEKISAPFKVGGRYFFFKNDGLQNQSAMFVQDSLDAEPKLLLDPNTWSKDGTVALAGMALTDDAKFLAYGTADAGSDWNTWKVFDVAAGKTVADELKWVKFSGASWTLDGKGFYYSRFPEPKKDAAFQSLNENQALYFHKLGTPQSEDKLVYERPDNPKWTVGGSVTEDGKFLIISVGDGTTSRKARVAYQDLTDPKSKPVDLVANHENKFNFLGNDGGVFYFQTDYKAPKYQIVAIDTAKPEPKDWKTIVPEANEVLDSTDLVGNRFICSYLKDAKTAVKVYEVDGKFVRDVALPGIGTASGFSGKRTDTETFYTFSSFDSPTRIYRYDVPTGESKLIRQAKVKFNPDDYEVKQVFYASKDGTKVPMFLAHKKGLKLDGSNPTLLYGYGGFNISLTPGFSVSRLQWMEMGGVLAVANLRGGGEYGDAWHRAGTKLQKQNVFDDFIAAAEYLVKEKYTSPKKLAIQGGSNGGLLVGACLTQRPDLFGACLPAVGVMDMLRFQKFTAGRFWVDDYGSSDKADEFEALYKFSPYHVLLKNGPKAYPATMVTTADTDDRVVPGHSFKFAAALQANQSGPAPVLIRIETKAGHGAGKPTAKVIEEVADQWAFLVKTLDFKPEIGK
ncbi:prolyl endopeptidase : Prolyl oligopeptidase OS=Planctomyces brasiliensis (strain ATCC 49424 / DSM 5305 / JCM 21570 / NBRC 103401 / IFAM 1448) GN=Plabr_0450 PE=4 SV=1: Peptidase_S9_N: Peptidase_S9 [Gemmataceae bacterium]|nr:prolyl endopeptidase : Prolyl oligopeptidase OS=Planctomyces brasiliensis (strain ATCC 49424 / DSM 5305 / JCM 21570 / NBRC 103401 / IFAM 1448) GN=Plabr_0450 PE=4 SV=1: Peptidase_S9_N: Peptidase_S9 [Gemmataceae bacterium]VTT97454.1 prolyl endopeptidase : Prolyl oligopeptidase OS=Planctomyces brasiliensis (strain ATCC 49424 / DSM 5305 / JCM 21570 / NBRC 103401 / IFAM 1448) GN=Plabr_0450 PE=4 SV=1: Peptidase_S9_N: Peptidase_S9 [Gemmataceae bacterium]